MSEDAPAAKLPIYKKWWFWAIIVFVFICIGAGAGSTAVQENGKNQNQAQDEDLNTGPADEPKNEELAKLNLRPQTVRNDVTGNWRISVIASPTVISDYAHDYYKEYVKDDEEIHFITNLTLKTTTKIAKTAMGLNVTVYEYVDGEEHDAKKLASGMILADEYYDSETGEKIEL